MLIKYNGFFSQITELTHIIFCHKAQIDFGPYFQLQNMKRKREEKKRKNQNHNGKW